MQNSSGTHQLRCQLMKGEYQSLLDNVSVNMRQITNLKSNVKRSATYALHSYLANFVIRVVLSSLG